jgi:predicted deacetylase
MPCGDTTPSLCIAIHDVAPATWTACGKLIRMLDDCGEFPLTLLLVPDYHGRGALDNDREFCHVIDQRLARGDEVVLHGYRHRDDGASVAGPLAYARRRIYTAGEGEFSALSLDEAQRRLAAGRAMFNRLGWPVTGFVAPAWLLSTGAWPALVSSGFRYTADRRGIYSLPERRFIPAPALVYSTRSAWRRSASRWWNGHLHRRLFSAPVVRLALHPADAAYPDVVKHWADLARSLGAGRRGVTKRMLAESAP